MMKTSTLLRNVTLALLLAGVGMSTTGCAALAVGAVAAIVKDGSDEFERQDRKDEASAAEAPVPASEKAKLVKKAPAKPAGQRAGTAKTDQK